MRRRSSRLLALLLSLAMVFSLFPIGALAVEGEEETPAEDISAEETPVEETPAEEMPVEEMPVEEMPVEEMPVEEVPAEETPAEPTNTVQSSVEFSGSCGESLRWELTNDGVLTVSGTGPMNDSEERASPWYDCRYDIYSVILSPGMTTIGNYAFEECDSITSINIPDTVISIGSHAFKDCNKLASVAIPGSVTSIGEAAFTYCGLTSVTVPGSVTAIPANAFNSCDLESVTIPGSVTSIGENAFNCCYALESVTIPGSVKSVGSEAFGWCFGLQSVTFLGDMPEIASDGFLGVTAEVHYPVGNATYTAANTPGYGGTLTWLIDSGSCGENLRWTLDIRGVLTVSGSGPMEDNPGWFERRESITSVILTDGVTSIGNNAFYCCALTSVTIPDSVQSIGYGAFNNCGSLESAVIPNGVTTIDDYAFYWCSSMTSVTIPDSVTTIGEMAFTRCDLSAVTIPAKVTSIGSSAFNGCSALKSVTFLGDMPEIAGDCFTNVTADVHYPAGNATYTAEKMLNYGGKLSWDAAITESPANVTVKAGNKASFSVTVIGAAPTYQWQYRKSADRSWTKTTATGYDTATLTVAATLAKNSYQYRCRITCGGKNAYSAAATLTVWGISTQPTSVTVKAGGTAAFTVAAQGAELTYQWQYRKSASASWTNTTATGYDTATLTVAATLAKNGYQYRCKLSCNGKNAYSDPATLTVWGISAQPNDKTVKPGGTATFTVKAQGNELSYQWQYRKSADRSWTNTTATGCKTATLTLPATAARSGYQYRCKVSCNGKNAYSDPATLTVWGITAQPTSVTVKAGGTASFTVAAQGAELSYQWQYRKSASASWSNTTATGCKTATLTLPATASRNGYQYRCRISCGGQTINSNAATLTVQ